MRDTAKMCFVNYDHKHVFHILWYITIQKCFFLNWLPAVEAQIFYQEVNFVILNPKWITGLFLVDPHKIWKIMFFCFFFFSDSCHAWDF